MTLDVGRFEANERVDLADFSFVVDESMRSQSRHWADQFFRDPARDGPNWVLDGFDITYLASELTVLKGRGILGHRENGEIFYGSLTTEGPAERVVDVSTFANGTYGVYIRFELVDGESGSRAFWNPQGDGAEFAQTIPTRRQANWSVRVELSNPGSEWLKIGEAVVAGGAVTGVTEGRDFFFEGVENDGYKSQWSTDGGGVAVDRNADRATYGVKGLHTFTAAMRQCLEDIKGRGLRRWWDRSIGGMNIGFDNEPVENRLAIGDPTTAFNLFWDGTDPYIYWGSDDYVWFDRSATALYTVINTVNRMRIDSSGVRATGLAVSSNISIQPVTGRIYVGDANFGLTYDATTPVLYFDQGAGEGGWIRYNRTTNHMEFGTDNNLRLELYDGILFFEQGDVGKIVVRDANFGLEMIATDFPKVRFNDQAHLTYDRSTDDDFYFIIGNLSQWRLSSTGMYAKGIAVSSDLSVAPASDTLRIQDQYFELAIVGSNPCIFFNRSISAEDYLQFSRSTDVLNLYTNATNKHYWASNRAWMLGFNGYTNLASEGEYSIDTSRGVWLIRDENNTGAVNTHTRKGASSLIYRNIAYSQTVTTAEAILQFACVKGGRQGYKVFRLTTWGTAKNNAAGALTLRMGVYDGTTYHPAIFYVFTPDATDTDDDARDQWWGECIFFMPSGGASVRINTFARMSFHEQANSDSQAFTASTSYDKVVGVNMDSLDLRLYVSGQAGADTITVHVRGFMVEELFGV